MAAATMIHVAALGALIGVMGWDWLLAAVIE